MNLPFLNDLKKKIPGATATSGFSFLSLPFLKKKSETLGIDIGSKATKLVKLIHREGQNPRLDFCGAFEADSQAPDFTQTLNQFLTKNRLTGYATAASFDNASLKIRKIELPKMPEADLREAVKFKMRDVVEGPIEGYVVRSSLLDETSKDTKHVLLVGYAVKKEPVNTFIQLMNQAGLRPDLVEPTTVTLAASIEAIKDPKEEWIGGIDLGASKSLMVLMGKGKFYFSRPLAGIRPSTSPDEEATFNQRLAAEIQHTLDTFSVTFRVEQINHLYVSGGGASLPDIANYLSTNLGLPAEIINPFQKMDVPSAWQPVIAEKAYLYSQAVGSARLRIKT